MSGPDVLGLFAPGSQVDGLVAEDALRQRARDYLAAFRSRWARTDVAFASKAFPCTAIQRLLS